MTAPNASADQLTANEHPRVNAPGGLNERLGSLLGAHAAQVATPLADITDRLDVLAGSVGDIYERLADVTTPIQGGVDRLQHELASLKQDRVGLDERITEEFAKLRVDMHAAIEDAAIHIVATLLGVQSPAAVAEATAEVPTE